MTTGSLIPDSILLPNVLLKIAALYVEGILAPSILYITCPLVNLAIRPNEGSKDKLASCTYKLCTISKSLVGLLSVFLFPFSSGADKFEGCPSGFLNLLYPFLPASSSSTYLSTK